jgi:drug/metabolite transporter (DMT)-like permease
LIFGKEHFIYPLLIFNSILFTFGSYFFLKEQIGIKGWIGVIVGFIGILFIAEFDGSSLEKTDYLGILSGVGAALAYTSIRELRRFYDSRAIVLSFMAVGTIFPLIFMIISEFYTNPHLDFMLGTFVMPEARDWIYYFLLTIIPLITIKIIPKSTIKDGKASPIKSPKTIEKAILL